MSVLAPKSTDWAHANPSFERLFHSEEAAPHQKKQPQFADTILEASDVARLYKLHERQVRRLANKGVIPAKKIGMRWRFSKSVLDAWFQDGVQSDAPRALAG